MRVMVTGASGNIGTAVVRELLRHPDVESVLGVCRRAHDWRPDGVRWVWADVADDDLGPHLAGADVVIHLAWLFHPMRRPDVTWHANVQGTKRLLEATTRADITKLVVASSVGAYTARRDTEPVDESWPTDGVPQAAYSREKAYVERMLDRHELEHPQCQVARKRPAFIFRRRPPPNSAGSSSVRSLLDRCCAPAASRCFRSPATCAFRRCTAPTSRAPSCRRL